MDVKVNNTLPQVDVIGTYGWNILFFYALANLYNEYLKGKMYCKMKCMFQPEYT